MTALYTPSQFSICLQRAAI